MKRMRAIERLIRVSPGELDVEVPLEGAGEVENGASSGAPRKQERQARQEDGQSREGSGDGRRRRRRRPRRRRAKAA
jgi:hypothetical protein